MYATPSINALTSPTMSMIMKINCSSSVRIVTTPARIAQVHTRINAQIAAKIMFAGRLRTEFQISVLVPALTEWQIQTECVFNAV